MYCPGCGSEERQMSQYCRACGTDLRPVRVSLERPDSVTASAMTAREEVGRAMAAKIRDVEDSHLHRIAEDVLPQIEKFLESPEEKRLRRLRTGVITAAIGLGAGIFAIGAARAIDQKDLIPPFAIMFGLAVVTFLLGLGFVMNGVLFTRPRKEMEAHSSDAARQNLLDALGAPSQLRSGDQPEASRVPTAVDFSRPELRAGASVTEQTTRHLKSE